MSSPPRTTPWPSSQPRPTRDLPARATARIRAALRAQGAPIGPYDALLAGTALANGLVMVTANRSEFERVAGLAVEDWSQP
ncbi:PIN domain-containing protein [Thiohalocapsa sp.]|uniref:PIN domain-containing protein n=1 Tax=Thiohalocapsa sp. TaxID=2497641 RepID=UPI00345BC9E8